MKRVISISFFFLFLIVVSGCKTRRPVLVQAPVDPFPTGKPEQPLPKQVIITRSAAVDSIKQGQLNYTTLSTKAKATILADGKENDVTMNIRLEKDKAIWVSVTATIAGIEVARTLITPDSILLISRATKEFLVKPFSYLEQYTGKGVSFGMLQSLLTGAVLPATPDSALVAYTGANKTFSGSLSSLVYLLTSDNGTRLIQTDLKNSRTSQLLHAAYADFTTVNGQAFPQTVSIKSSSISGVAALDMKYGKITWNGPLDMPFSIPRKYTQIN